MRPWLVGLSILAFLMSSSALATTVEPMTFSRMVDESEMVIEGTVVDLWVTATGTAKREPRDKVHAPPKTPAGEERKARAAESPQALGVEGGRMLFTWVTMNVDEEIVGHAGARVSFRVAGGSDGQVKVVVHGLPGFKVGMRYIVFLRHGFEQTADPVVGVNQGYFAIVHDREQRRDVLLNAKGDVVLGVAGDRLITRFNRASAEGPTPRLGPPPVPDAGSGIHSRISPEVARYWLSTDEPITKEEFLSTIRAERERQ